MQAEVGRCRSVRADAAAVILRANATRVGAVDMVEQVVFADGIERYLSIVGLRRQCLIHELVRAGS